LYLFAFVGNKLNQKSTAKKSKRASKEEKNKVTGVGQQVGISTTVGQLQEQLAKAKRWQSVA